MNTHFEDRVASATRRLTKDLGEDSPLACGPPGVDVYDVLLDKLAEVHLLASMCGNRSTLMLELTESPSRTQKVVHTDCATHCHEIADTAKEELEELATHRERTQQVTGARQL